MTRSLSLFYLYDQKDKLLQERLEKHLSILTYMKLITTWNGQKILADQEKVLEVNTYLDNADIILLLVSADFLSSYLYFTNQIANIMYRYGIGTVSVIPILLRPVDWEGAPFSHLRFLPSNGKPVTRWRSRDEAFVDIAKGIRTLVTAKRDTRGQLSGGKGDVSGAVAFTGNLPREAPATRTYNYPSLPESGFATDDSDSLSSEAIEESTVSASSAILQDQPLVSPYIEVLNDFAGTFTLDRSKDKDASFHLLVANILSELRQIDPLLRFKLSEVNDELARRFAFEGEALSIFSALISEDKRYNPDLADLRALNHVLEIFGKYYSFWRGQQEKAWCTSDPLATVALGAYSISAALHPASLNALYGKGKLLFELGFFREALAIYQKSVSFQPNNPQAYYSYGLILGALRRRKDSDASYQQAIKLDPNVSSNYQDWEYAITLPTTQMESRASQLEQSLKLYSDGKLFGDIMPFL